MYFHFAKHKIAKVIQRIEGMIFQETFKLGNV